MYYHTVVLHLFRPFLKVDLTNSKVSPREICTSCADSIALLLSSYRQTYGFRRVIVLLTHIVLTSSIIHLLDLPNPSSARNLAESISCLHETSTAHAFAMRALNVIMTLARQWNISLPAEVSQAAFGSLQDPTMIAANGAQDLPRVDPYPLPILDSTRQQENTNELPFATMKNSPRRFSTPADLFWSPFPDQGLPLQAHHQGGPMDISAMLSVPNEWDQLNRDGFRAASTNNSILVPLAYNHVNSQWPQT